MDSGGLPALKITGERLVCLASVEHIIQHKHNPVLEAVISNLQDLRIALRTGSRWISSHSNPFQRWIPLERPGQIRGKVNRAFEDPDQKEFLSLEE